MKNYFFLNQQPWLKLYVLDLFIFTLQVEKASRIMQFLIDNYGVDEMFGRENIRFFAETTHTGIQIRELIRSYCPDAQVIPCKL